MSRFRAWALPLALCLIAGCGAPAPAELLADAEAAITAGDLGTANVHLRNLLQQEPDNARGRELLGRVALALGDFSSAESQLRRAVGLGVAPELVQLPLVRALVGQSQFAEAVAQIRDGPALQGDERLELLRVSSAAYRGLGDNEAAEAALREALAGNPASLPVRTELASLLLSSGRADDAAGLVANVLDADPGYSPALLLRGQLERMANRPEAAERTFRQVIGAETVNESDRFVARIQLTELLLARGAVDEAAALSDEILANMAGNPIAEYVKARVEVEQGAIDAAERRLENVLVDYPDYAPANQLLGAINTEQEQFGQAEMYLRAAVADAPDDPGPRLQLVETYLRQGKIDAARELLSATYPAADSEAVMLALAGRANLATGNSETAGDYFSRSEQASVETPEQLFGLASIYAAVGEYDRAVRVLESTDLDGIENQAAASYLLVLTHLARNADAEALQEAEDLAASRPDVAWPRSLLGAIALRMGDTTAARDHFTQALEIEPGQIPVLFNLARVEALLGDVGRAEEALEQILEIDEMHAETNLVLAGIALGRNELDAASAYLARVPDSPARMQLEGRLAFAEGRPSDGAAAFAELFERDPTAETALLAYSAARAAGEAEPDRFLRARLATAPQDPSANFALGTHAIETGQAGEAAARFEAVLAVQADHVGALNNLAYLYGESGDPRALDFGRRAYEAAPDNAFVADTLGWLLVRNDDPTAGLPFLQQAVDGAPDNAEIRYHWAVAAAETGDSETAIAALEAVLAQDTEYPWRADAEQRLEGLRR